MTAWHRADISAEGNGSLYVPKSIEAQVLRASGVGGERGRIPEDSKGCP